MLRHCDSSLITFWLVTTKPFHFECLLKRVDTNEVLIKRELDKSEVLKTQVGQHAFIYHLTVRSDKALPEEVLIEYQLNLLADHETLPLTQIMPELLYDGQTAPSFIIKPTLEKVLHGSCRKPHFNSEDGLVHIDELFTENISNATERPSLVMMSGDQIYVDDVSGPMLVAVHQVIQRLGLYDEVWQNEQSTGNEVTQSQALFEHPDCYYRRHLLLPQDRVNRSLWERYFAASKKPIFTSVNAKNHLVTLSEIIAQYLLIWSPTLWQLVDLTPPQHVTKDHQALYQREQKVIEQFAEKLTSVRRALAHIPVYMIFDDHDVTDDWNLTRGWEEAAYEHPFSKRIIGNALIGYYLCQGLGNGVDRLSELTEKISHCFTEREVVEHDHLVDEMLAWDQWHYHLNTTPKMVVLDTRTQRWRSESKASKPSGLMDWESLTELQQELINQPAIIMVSAAPIYGVKLIEAVQRVFTFFGNPLAVDAENWMAHSGTANVMLNIFRHHKTPPHFIILSGDVHYSFVYDVTHRFRRNSSQIIQITCSGIRNTFPQGLLNTLERLNYYLYGSYSPLNWFTKRRRMKISVRKPDVCPDKTLYNGSGIGLMTLDSGSEQVKAELIIEGGKRVVFEQADD